MLNNLNCNSPWIKGSQEKFESIFKLHKIGNERTYGASESIYLQDDLGNTFYYIKTGRVKVFILQEDGTEKTLSIHEQGCFFGETTVIDQLPRPCCASAMVNSEIIALTHGDLLKLIQLDKDLYLALLQSLTRKIRMLSFQIQDMAFLEAEQRIIHILLKLAGDFGTTTEEGLKLSVSFTDQELAGLVGVCRVTVTKTLNSLKKQGFIDKQCRTITIKNQMGLLKALYSTESNRNNSCNGLKSS
jgi:CRP/FNR family transcriptional regulator, cyclic AMP receptor protein